MATPADTEKWETGIDATTADIKEVKAFVDWRLSIYKENGWKGFDLWESFVDDFETFTKDILDNLGKDRLKKIRDYLRENGVYIRKEARKSIADGLLGAIHEPTPSEWPADDPADDPAPALSTSTNPAPALSPSTDPAPAISSPSATPTPALPSPSTAPVQAIQLLNTPSTQTTVQGSFGREITNLTKSYTDEVKYSSKQDLTEPLGTSYAPPGPTAPIPPGPTALIPPEAPGTHPLPRQPTEPPLGATLYILSDIQARNPTQKWLEKAQTDQLSSHPAAVNTTLMATARVTTIKDFTALQVTTQLAIQSTFTTQLHDIDDDEHAYCQYWTNRTSRGMDTEKGIG